MATSSTAALPPNGYNTTSAMITTAVVGVTIVYWTSSTNVAVLRSAVCDFLHATGILRDGSVDATAEQSPQIACDEKEEWRNAFESWIEFEEIDESLLPYQAIYRSNMDLTNPEWMGELIQDGLLSRYRVGMEIHANFVRVFRTLQRGMRNMTLKDSGIREKFFNGSLEGNYQSSWIQEERDDKGRLRALSISSTSTCSSSNTTDDYVVEDEEEIARLLKYVRLIQVAGNMTMCNHVSDPYFKKPKIGKRILGMNDYEEFGRCASTVLLDTTNCKSGVVGYLMTVNRRTRELVFAVHYHEGRKSDASRNRIETAIRYSEELQTKMDPSRPCLFHDAFEYLRNEITVQYMEPKNGIETTSFSELGYSIVLCGHSVGAALACRLGRLLRESIRVFQSLDSPLNVYAFGPPPCFSSTSAEDDLYITSVVNNHDCIPRWRGNSIEVIGKQMDWAWNQNLDHFRKWHSRSNQLKRLNRPTPRISSFCLSPKGLVSLWQKKSDKHNEFWRVPGNVICIWNHSNDPTIIGAKFYRSKHTQSCAKTSNFLHHDALRRIWVNETMFSDHTIDAYQSNLELLLGQVSITI